MYVIIKKECMIQIVHTLQDIPLKREIVSGHTNQNLIGNRCIRF